MNETWRDIPNYKGLYMINNKGNILSLKYRKYQGKKLLKLHKDKDGYLVVGLSKKGRTVTYKVHRLVMLSFVGYSKLQVNHIDGNKINNCVTNLEYCTPLENVRHAIKNSLNKNLNTIGLTIHNNSIKVPVYQYNKKGDLLAVYESQHEAFLKTGVNAGNISACVRGMQKSAGGYIWENK